MTDTIIGVYDQYSNATRSREELLTRGFPAADVQLSPQPDSASETGTGKAMPEEAERGSAFGNFFKSLFGSSDKSDDAEIYSEALRRGNYLVTVTARDEQHCEEAIEVLSHNGAIDINDRSAQWRDQGWDASTGSSAMTDAPMTSVTSTDLSANMTSSSPAGGKPTTLANAPGATAASLTASTAGKLTEDTPIQVIQEELAIGKREIDRGGVRVYRRVEETPVHESVQLRQEEVVVERRPVDREATPEQLAGAFTEGTLEVRERGEEAVVAKTARVVEEVFVGKEVRQETETIDDTLRRTDVDIEELPATRSAGSVSSGDALYREHWKSEYSTLGGSYDDYAPAYMYGSTIASDKRYAGDSDWTTLESRVRPDWEKQHPGSTWERFKGAVRHGWESMTGKR